MEPSVDSAAQDKCTAGELVTVAQRIDRFGIRVSRVSPSGKYLAQLRVHKRLFPLWWKWETVGYSVSPDYEAALQVMGRFVNSIFSNPIQSGHYHIPILLEFGAVHAELPDDME